MEWIKITDAESIPQNVPLWVFYKRIRSVALLEPEASIERQMAISRLCTHYMHVQAPPPPEED